MDPVLITIKQFNDLYGIGRTRTYELINDGTIETVKVGRRRLIKNASAHRALLGEVA